MEPEPESVETITKNIEKMETIIKNYEKEGFTKLILNQNYDKIIKEKEKFVDNLFPPENCSIYHYLNEQNKIKKTSLLKKHKDEEVNKF